MKETTDLIEYPSFCIKAAFHLDSRHDRIWRQSFSQLFEEHFGIAQKGVNSEQRHTALPFFFDSFHKPLRRIFCFILNGRVVEIQVQIPVSESDSIDQPLPTVRRNCI